MIVTLFAGLDFNIQTVFRRRQRTGGKGSKGTRRLLGLVEIKDRFTVDGLIRMEKTSRLVRLRLIRAIAKDDKQRPIVVLNCLMRILFSFEGDFQNSLPF